MISRKIFTAKNYFWIGVGLSLVIAIGTRFIGLTQFPPSLYWEEAALGYDAYSILKTGHDFHGHFLPVVAFESFGDYKPSFYFYALVPSIAIFGLTDFAVRFPSAVSGVLLVIGVGFVARELGYSLKRKSLTSVHLPSRLQVLAMFISSVNPWAIEFSRGGWEVNVATTLLTWGIWLQLIFRRKILSVSDDKERVHSFKLISMLVVGTVLIAASMYTYHATRLIAPFLLLIFWIQIWIELWQLHRKKHQRQRLANTTGFLIGSGILFITLISPIIFSLNSPQTQQRFAETSLFADGRQVILSNELIAQSRPQWFGKIIYHRYVISAEMLLENYLTHFTFKFLFLSGDTNPRHSTQYVGLMYSGEVVLLLAGLYFFFVRRNSLVFFASMWLLFGIVPASLTTATPHALRILPTLPVWMILLSGGAIQIWIWGSSIKRLKNWAPAILLTCFAIFYGWQFVCYWRFYSLIYPKIYVGEWQYGYQQLVAKLADEQMKYPTIPIQITREYGRPSTYYWFYTQTNPTDVQAEEKTAKKDQGEFLQFKNISFVDQVQVSQPTLVASSQDLYNQIVLAHPSSIVLDKITDPLHKVVWVIYLAQ